MEKQKRNNKHSRPLNQLPEKEIICENCGLVVDCDTRICPGCGTILTKTFLTKKEKKI